MPACVSYKMLVSLAGKMCAHIFRRLPRNITRIMERKLESESTASDKSEMHKHALVLGGEQEQLLDTCSNKWNKLIKSVQRVGCVINEKRIAMATEKLLSFSDFQCFSDFVLFFFSFFYCCVRMLLLWRHDKLCSHHLI